MSSEELSRIDAVHECCRRHRVTSLYAFGSRAAEAFEWTHGKRDEFEPTSSDLDLAVTLEEGVKLSARDRVRLSIEFERLFGVPQVDLVLLIETDVFLAVDAVRGELLYCDDEDRQAREELYYLRRAADLMPFQKDRLDGLLSGEYRR